MCVFCSLLFVLLSFFFAFVLFVLLRYTNSDYHFGIFKFSVFILIIRLNIKRGPVTLEINNIFDIQRITAGNGHMQK